MILVPDSESLQEFNPCHDPQDGKFAAAGRCTQGAKVIRKRVADDIRKARTLRRRLAQGNPDKTPTLGDYDLDYMIAHAYHKRRALKQPTGPAYLLPEIQQAAAVRLAVFLDRHPLDVARKYRSTTSGGTAFLGLNSVVVRPDVIAARVGTKSDKAATLTVLRHELGHQNPHHGGRETIVAGIPSATLATMALKKANTNARKMGISMQYYEDYEPSAVARKNVMILTEEVRAWRNAIRAGRGRIDWASLNRSLSGYTKGILGDRGRIAKTMVGTLKRYARRLRHTMRKGTT